MGKQKKEGNAFDKILKESAEEIFLPLVARQLGIKILSSEVLPEKLQTTMEREMDFLRLVKTIDGEEMIIHIEFQTQSDKEMIFRISEYHGIELRKHKIQVKHFVVYLGKSKPNMRTRLKKEEVFLGFELINLQNIHYDEFLSSQVPAEILLAILADFKEEQADAVIRLIIKKLKATCQNVSDLRKFVKQLTVLSRLRNLDDQTKKIVTTMPITYDITKDSFYKEGLERGLEKVKEEKDLMIRTMLRKELDIKIIAEIANVTQKYVRQVQKEMMSDK